MADSGHLDAAAQRSEGRHPITQIATRSLFENKDVLQALTELMTRDPKPEV